LTHSEILDYLSKEDVEKKIEALLVKDTEQREQRREAFNEMIESSIPDEEKERVIQDMVNESFSGSAAIEREQRLTALQIREDYADLKKNENRAFNAILAGNLAKYDRCIAKAVKAADMVDMGLEFLENAADFFSQFKVTKVKFVSEEEAKQRLNTKTLRLDNIDQLL
jgi:hypothetical protein